MREQGAAFFFLRHFIGAERLYEAMLLPTQRCNLRCRHCNARTEPRPELSAAVWRRTLTDLQRCGTMQVTFSGGEPLLRPDLPALLRHADGLGLALTLFSNGQLLDRARVAALRGLRWREITLSLYSVRAHEHDRLTRHPGSWVKTAAALARLADAGLPVAVNCMTLRGLRPAAQNEVFQWASGRGYRCHTGSMLLPVLDGDLAPLRLRRIVAVADAPRVGAKAWRRGCGCGEAATMINAYGDCYPCSFFPAPLGNVCVQTVSAIRRQSPLLPVIRRGLDRIALRRSCRQCRQRVGCRQCFGQAFLETGTCYRPAAASCAQFGRSS
ncbi:MAG TPA: radical SAM/SPASM domain-containing protein [bacterium]|nr:radical SAM/SPASM domain-containing protein [bacterium]